MKNPHKALEAIESLVGSDYGQDLECFDAGMSKIADRWFALGNAVNCKLSEYLFMNYLPEVWQEFKK